MRLYEEFMQELREQSNTNLTKDEVSNFLITFLVSRGLAVRTGTDMIQLTTSFYTAHSFIREFKPFTENLGKIRE